MLIARKVFYFGYLCGNINAMRVNWMGLIIMLNGLYITGRECMEDCVKRNTDGGAIEEQ